MPKETLIPVQYPPQSPHQGHYPMHPNQQSRPPPQQPPPSTAAAKAAAAAKALHRRALDRAQQKQSQPPPHTPRHDPRWESQQQNDNRNDDKRRSTMAVFRRPPANNDQESRYRSENGYSQRPPTHSDAQSNAHSNGHSNAHPNAPSHPHPQSGRGRSDEYKYDKSNAPSSQSSQGPPPYPPQMPPGYHYGIQFPPPNYPYMPPPPPNYPDDDKNNSSKGSDRAAPQASAPVVHRPPPREDYPPRYHDPRYGYDPNNYTEYQFYPGYPYFMPDSKNGNVGGGGPAPPYPVQDKNNTPPSHRGPPDIPMEDNKIKYQEDHQQQQQPASKGTRRVIGSHTPIHVPRAEDSPLPYHHCNGSNNGPFDHGPSGAMSGAAARSSVFRSQESHDSITQKEHNAHEILLSLSKSFEKNENERPKSPEEPPRLKQFHKERGEGFEPQPSPLRVDKTTDQNENDIEFAPSFALFNQSFDMNLESLLGPNASFGLGPMKSLSFGLGGLGSVDYGDPRASPISIHRVASRVDKDKKENVQVLRASPSNSFGNVLHVASSNGSEKNKGVMLLSDSVRVDFPSANGKKRSPSSEAKNIVLDGNARNLPFKLKDNGHSEDKANEHSQLNNMQPPAKKKKASKPSRVDLSLFKIIENHRSTFSDFTFLLAGAKAILSKKSGNISQAEIARRRINSALCAFGGSALPKQAPETKTACQRKYEQMLPDRYYEDDNRLSWEVEEDPPVEISDEEASSSKDKLSTCGSAEDYSALALQRNMGVMVYPALNAFAAAEPGIITAALSEMNNFVSGKSPECTPAKETVTTLPPVTKMQILPMVSPDCVKPEPDTFPSDDNKSYANHAGGAWMSSNNSKNQSSKKELSVPDHLFIDAQQMKSEQYRVVTVNKYHLYEYPSLPVPYAQRKRMSNAVFAMSKNIPGLTDECAAVLSEARKKDAWDFAVAELMTQVVILTHCTEEDCRLDGLSKYLLTLGISC